MATVYNSKGEAVEVDHVDAREYVASGQYTWTLPVAEEPKETALTVAEIKEKLAELNIEIPDGVTKKSDLLALLG